MRPLKIVMSAFGSYADKTEIDMTKLGSHGLYLITGDTGAGKTTIFDGICYALYGCASGDNRTEKMLRSKYADEKTLTYVELTFEYKGKEYFIHREPARIKMKKDGTGLTRADGQCRMEQKGKGVIADKKTNVDKKVHEIVGLTQKQYSQVAMIAQGDFHKLLFSSTQDRREVLQTIFGTQKFEKLRQAVSEEFSKINKECENSLIKIKQTLSGITVGEENEFFEELESAKSAKEVANPDELTELCKNAAKAEEKSYRLADEEYCAQDKLYNALKTEYDGSKALAEVFGECEKCRADLSESRTQMESDKRLLEAEKAKAPERDRLSAELGRKEDVMNRLSEVERLAQEVSQMQTRAKQCADGSKEKSLKLTELEDLLARSKKLSEELKDCAAEKAECDGKIDRCKRDIREILGVGKLLGELEKQKKSLEEKQTDYRRSFAEYKKYEQEYSRMETAFYNCQAGILAESLEVGKPCPVCGSRLHPDPACRVENAPDKESLDKMKSVRDRASQQMQNFAGICQLESGRYETARKTAAENARKYLGCEDTDEALKLARMKYRENTDILKDLEKQSEKICEKIDFRDKTLKEIPLLEQQISAVREEISVLERNFAGYSSAAEEKSARLNETKKSLPFESREKAGTHFAQVLREISKLDSGLKTAQESFDASREKTLTLSARLEELEKQTAGKSRPDTEAIGKRLSQSLERRKELSEKRDSLLAVTRKNDIQLSLLKRQLEEDKAVTEKRSWIAALNNTATGNVSRKSKISLETYVQMSFFDRILRRANIRLLKLANGDFELKRSESGDNRSQTGLEIDVIDHRTGGTVSSVRSLSGGETFIASLALALGLSDEIQQAAGGIQLDSMFIDEGFGTLDEKYLDQAIRVLVSLAEDKRLVGIISHVEGLKERISRQIVVRKNNVSGSSVEIIS